MNESIAFGVDDLTLMWRVLGAWVRISDRTDPGGALGTYIREFRAVQYKPLLMAVPKHALPMRLHDNFGWIVGSPLPREGLSVIPVATVSVGPLVGDRVSECAIRVALLRDRADLTVEAEGWRFESGEQPVDGQLTPPAHPYCHVQAITGWDRDPSCLLHPTHEEGAECDGLDPTDVQGVDGERKRAASATLVRHPAFPLSASTLTGMALNVVAALYGVSAVLDLLQVEAVLQRVDGEVRRDLERLVASI